MSRPRRLGVLGLKEADRLLRDVGIRVSETGHDKGRAICQAGEPARLITQADSARSASRSIDILAFSDEFCGTVVY